MLTKDMAPDAKLREGMRLYGEARGHWMDAKERMDAAFAFAHGNQWHANDLKILKEEGRPALTFNLVQQKVQQAVGMNEDNKRAVVAAAVGASDRALADACNALLAHFYRQSMMDEVDSEAYEHGVIAGEGAIHISFERDPKMPLWAQLKATIVNPKEVYWDPASRARNRSDARYVIWPRWVSKEEFIAEYPQLEGKVTELFDADGNALEIKMEDNHSDFYDPSITQLVDTRRGRLCILHIEYLCPHEKFFLTDGQQAKEVDPEHAQAMQSAAQLGGAAAGEVVASWAEEVYWLEMIGNEVLFDDVSPEPFDGYSLVPWTCYLDPRSGYTSGMVRALMDPQRDVNKAYSQSLDHISAQAKPGYIAEEQAVPDVNEFDRRNRIAGSVTIVKEGALSSGAIQPRQVPVYSPAASQRLTQSIEMLDRVSGIATDLESPARAVEAATTQLLREKKAIRAMRGVLYRFQRAQREVGRRVLEGIARSVPDDQIVAILSDSERYRLTPQGVVDLKLQAPINIRDLRSLKTDIDLDPSSESDTQRAMQLEVLAQLAAAAKVPVDPEVILELASTTRSMRERLTNYFKQIQQMNQQMTMQEKSVELQGQMALAKANTTLAEAEAIKARADAGNVALESQRKRALDQQNLLLKLLELWERADANEKKLLVERLRIQEAGNQPAQQ